MEQQLFGYANRLIEFNSDIAAALGKIDLATNPSYELNLAIAPFSPRKITAALGQKFSLKTTKPNLLEHLALKAHVIGDTKSIAISEGNLNFDQSKLNFSLDAKNFDKPDVNFDLHLDEIDLDGYLPPSSESKAQTEKKPQAGGPKKEQMDYAPLRKLAIEGKIQALALKVGGTQVQDLNLSVSGKDGFFRLDPLTAKVYQGNLSAKGSLDVREDQAKSNLTLETKGVQIGPLLRDQLKKDVLEGALQSKVTIAMTGDDADQIKRSLNGDGALIFNDGAIKGIDLPGMMRNVEAKFGLVKKGGERPRTDFSELKSQFTITNGVFNTLNTTMMSPVLRVVATGKADLVKETIDFTVEPKFVGTLKGQGDTKERSGVVVPVLVAGTFSSPTFRPDLVKMLKQDFTKVLPEAGKLIDRLKEQQDQGKEALKKTLEKGVLGQKQVPPEAPKEGSSQQEKPKTPEEQAKELLKGLPFSK